MNPSKKLIAVIVSAITVVSVPTSIFAFSSKDITHEPEVLANVDVGDVQVETVAKANYSTGEVDNKIAKVLDIETTTAAKTTTTATSSSTTTSTTTTSVASTETSISSETSIEATESIADTKAIETATTVAKNNAPKVTAVATTTTVATTNTDATEVTKAETTTTVAETTREYIVFKPGTHFVHKNTCKWVDDTCYEIADTNGIEARKCSDCNPDIEIVSEYVEPTNAPGEYAITVSDSDYILLCNCVAHEAGSNWISAYNKACVVEVIMNRVNSGAYPNSIYGVITQKGQFSGCWSYADLTGFSSKVTDLVKEGVDMYLSDPSQFNHGYYGFWGDGKQNHFR